MSELEKTLEQKVKETPEFLSVAELPEELVAKVQSSVFKTDKRGNEALFIRLLTKDNKVVIQKYTPTQYKYLLEQIRKCGGIENLKTNYYTWRKEKVGRAINERLFPTPKKKGE